MILEWLEEGLTREQVKSRLVTQLGMSESRAGFLIALEMGEVNGDVIEVAPDGTESTPDVPSLVDE